MTDELHRREFIKVSAASLGGASIAGCLSRDTGAAAFLAGPESARPAPDSAFFADKARYEYVYMATDTGAQFYIDTDATDWALLSGRTIFEDALSIENPPAGLRTLHNNARGFNTRGPVFYDPAADGGAGAWRSEITGDELLESVPAPTLESLTVNSGPEVFVEWTNNDELTEGDIDVERKEASAFASNWDYRKPITIDSAKVDADLTDYPATIHLDADSDLAAGAQSSGDDIKFEDVNGTQLSHEIESYDGSTGTLWAHVKLPSLSASSDTTIYIYYGNSDASNQESVADVWSNGYEAVYHLDESADGTGNADVYKDSTANNYHGDDNVSDTAQTGQIYDGQEFDGSDDDIVIGDIGVTDQSWTVSFWGATFTSDTVMYPVGLGSETAAIDIGEYNGNGAFLYDGSNIIGDGGSYSLGTTTKVTVRNDSQTYGIYRDGGKKNSAAGNLVTLDNLVLGQRGDDNWFTDCFVDELRISTVIRSDGWISTAYTNQNDPLSFYTVGGQESSSSDWTDVATGLSPSTTSYTDTTVSSGETYEFRVVRVLNAVESASDAVEVTV